MAILDDPMGALVVLDRAAAQSARTAPGPNLRSDLPGRKGEHFGMSCCELCGDYQNHEVAFSYHLEQARQALNESDLVDANWHLLHAQDERNAAKDIVDEWVALGCGSAEDLNRDASGQCEQSCHGGGQDDGGTKLS